MLATTKYACRRMATAVAASSDLFETSVTFKNSAGDNINLKAVFQDTLPSGSSIGTVIGLHGAPGSHLDFKYISPLLAKKSIRFIGINYPGFGVTPYDDLLKWNNVERHDYVLAILEHLKLHKNLVLLGHSRGTENAIMLGAERQGCASSYTLSSSKIKVPDGQMAAICMQTMENVALGGQKAYIEKINNSQTKVLFCYAGKDWLIENEISQDCAKAFNIDHFECETTEKDEEAALLEQISPSLKKKGCSVFFKADGHFLQKARAEFVSNAIEKMLTVDREAMLYAKRITYRGGKGQEITVDAVYQDTHPLGGGRAVVFAQHGSPGSHKDFKYMVPKLRDKDIRVISINYPGHGFTPNIPNLTWENVERNNYTRALLHSMKLLEKNNLIFLGHSRGGENSLQLGVEYINECIGIIKLNCPGLRMHRGIRPYWPLEMAMRLSQIDPLKPVMHPLIGWFYNKLGLRCPNGEVAATALLTLRTFAFDKQKPLIEIVSKHPKVRFMYGYSGSDFLIEPEHSHEMAECFEGRYHVECYTKGDESDDLRIRQEIKEHFLSGKRILTAYFDKEDHFLQKHRASSIVEAIDAMVIHHEKNSSRPSFVSAALCTSAAFLLWPSSHNFLVISPLLQYVYLFHPFVIQRTASLTVMSLQGKFLACRRITTTMPTRQELEQMIRIEPVTFNLPCGEEVTVESHIQDTLASGSDIGTVVCLHGSPGSYKDFKYITPHLHEKGIRVIGVNFPDYGLTAGHEKLGFCNAERNNYIKAVLDQVGVKDNLIVMGHSRGCENATGTAALLSDRLSGLVLLNPTGLRLHRGLRPFWLVPFVLWLHSINFIQNAIENFLYWFYNKIGLRLDSGRRAIACVRTMFHIELDKLKPKIDVINNTKQAKVLQAYSGKDLFIEPCVSQELAQSWHDHKDLTCKERSPEATERVTESTASYFKSGVKSVSVYFTEEDHFLQKHQPKFVADAIEAMLKA